MTNKLYAVIDRDGKTVAACVWGEGKMDGFHLVETDENVTGKEWNGKKFVSVGQKEDTPRRKTLEERLSELEAKVK